MERHRSRPFAHQWISPFLSILLSTLMQLTDIFVDFLGVLWDSVCTIKHIFKIPKFKAWRAKMSFQDIANRIAHPNSWC